MARKKRSKTLLLLTLLLALLVGATVAVMKLSPQEEVTEEETVNEGVEILTIEEASASSIDWTVGSESFAMSKSGEEWVLDSDPAFPLDQTHMENIFLDLGGLLAYNTLENVTDLAEYGLDEPTASIHVDGTTILLGDPAPMDSLRYLSLGDGKVYLVSNALLSNYNVTLDDLMAFESIPTFSNHQKISVVSGDSVLELLCTTNTSGESKTSVWTCGEQELDASLVQSFCENIQSLVWTDCVAYGVTDFAEYGLDAPLLTATVDWYDSASSSEQSFTLCVGADAAEGLCYARIDGSDMVYTLSSSVRDTLASAVPSDFVTAE